MDTDAVIEGLLGGDRRALARAVSMVEDRRAGAHDVSVAAADARRGIPVMGVTGPPGAGKSTLVSAVVGALRDRGQRVAVLAVDPTSPLSGGAILGDRVRMLGHVDDADVFVRSVASRGRVGGLAWTTAALVDLVDAAGYDLVVLETVGAGQSEVDVAAIADLTVVVVAPGAGDDVQAMKAGILEIADVLVVNKADLPGAETARRDLLGMLALADGRDVPVLLTVAIAGEGIDVLADLVPIEPIGSEALRRRIVAAIRAAAEERLRAVLADGEGLEGLVDEVLSGDVGVDEAARRWLAASERGG